MITILLFFCLVSSTNAGPWNSKSYAKTIVCNEDLVSKETGNDLSIIKQIDNLNQKLTAGKDKLVNHFHRRNAPRNHNIIVATERKSPAEPTGFFRSLFITKGGARKNLKKRVLILMCDTGGGHRASAQAIDRAISEIVPGKIDVQVMDIWTDHAKWPFNNFVPYYRFLAKHPLLWRGMYLFGNFPPTKLFTEMWSWYSCFPTFRKVIMNCDPDLVVSVHPLCQLMPISALKEMNKVRDPEKLRIPFVTVVTDLGGAHSTWFDKRTDLVFVPGETVRKLALSNRVKPEKIIMRGLPVRPAFWKPSKDKRKLRRELGLTQKVKTVLLMGGGDGVGGLDAIATRTASKLGQSVKAAQIVVICGHNAQTQSDLIAQKWPANVRVVVKGFCENIDQFMAASDCLVTKAGPGTIAEAMIQGLPCVLSSFLPGQVSYV
jgi:1,2-diacylglycerol 3-beta-galactosyltransferase